MGISERKEMEELLHLNGFLLKRSDGAHLVYSDGARNFVMSKTPSDWRAHENNIRDLKKVTMESGRVFQRAGEPKKERAMQQRAESAFKNTPLIKDTDERTVKPIDDFAIEASRKWKDEGLKQKDILDKLLALKYTQPGNAKPLDQSTLSRSLRANGIKWKDFYPRQQDKKEDSSVSSSRIIHQIEEIISSNLPVKLKEKFIVNIVNEMAST